MKRILAIVAMCGAAAVLASATPVGINELGGVEVSGSLADANTVDLFTFQFSGVGDLTIQSWGYGGALASQTLSGNPVDFSDSVQGYAGGFQSNLALFDSSGNLLADASQFINGNPQACPPANLDNTAFACGDPQLYLPSLVAGTYTLAIMAAPNDSNGSLVAGFTGGGSFIGFNGSDSPQYLVDLSGNATLPGTPSPVPEPATWTLMAAGAGLLGLRRKQLSARA